MTRFGYVMLTYFTAMGVAAAAIVPTSLKLVWNVSASAPIGFYWLDDRAIRPDHPHRTGRTLSRIDPADLVRKNQTAREAFWRVCNRGEINSSAWSFQQRELKMTELILVAPRQRFLP